MAGLLAHLLLAQLTLLLTAVFYAVGRVSRWRLPWLAVPAGAGLLWVLAVGPPGAASGLAAGPRRVLAYLGGIGPHPGRLLHLQDAFAGLTHWLPGQLPLALVLAAAEALGLCWLRLGRMRRQHGGEPAWRAGMIVAARRGWTTARIRAGGVVTRDGCCLGVDLVTGRPAAISWPEAEGGVLCAGPAAGQGPAGPGRAAGSRPAALDSGFMLAHAAIRRRKPLIVIDLTGSAALPGSLAAACAEPGAPMSWFGPAGPGCYEPLRGGDPARTAARVVDMLDWSEAGDQRRRSCGGYLTDALAVQAAAPRDRRVPALDDLVCLLNPGELRARAARIPAYHPRRRVLADRAGVSAGLLQAEPATVAVPLAQLPALRSSALGRWLRPAPPGAPQVSLGRTVRERAVTLFSLDCDVHGRSARMIAGLAAADLIAVCAELRGMSVPGDGVVWVSGCEVLGEQTLAELVTRGEGAGMAVVLGTASAAAADRLAAGVNVLVARGPAGPELAGRFAEAPRSRPGGPAGTGATSAGGAGPPDAVAAGRTGATARHPVGMNGGGPFRAGVPPHGADALALLSRGPRRRVLAQCRHVPASVRGAAAAGAGRAGRPE